MLCSCRHLCGVVWQVLILGRCLCCLALEPCLDQVLSIVQSFDRGKHMWPVMGSLLARGSKFSWDCCRVLLATWALHCHPQAAVL
jgi:hypothetical protein